MAFLKVILIYTHFFRFLIQFISNSSGTFQIWYVSNTDMVDTYTFGNGCIHLNDIAKCDGFRVFKSLTSEWYNQTWKKFVFLKVFESWSREGIWNALKYIFKIAVCGFCLILFFYRKKYLNPNSDYNQQSEIIKISSITNPKAKWFVLSSRFT